MEFTATRSITTFNVASRDALFTMRAAFLVDGRCYVVAGPSSPLLRKLDLVMAGRSCGPKWPVYEHELHVRLYRLVKVQLEPAHPCKVHEMTAISCSTPGRWQGIGSRCLWCRVCLASNGTCGLIIAYTRAKLEYLNVDTGTQRMFDPPSLYPILGGIPPNSARYNVTVDEEMINDATEQTQSQSDFVRIASERHLSFSLELMLKSS
ncbi:hypothetical protein IW262DRAFT_185091 [Armillaria fumosa]|nr:hypothetical protein IW262DRAFT_185091 [Armillaria fumosa]